MPVILHTSPSDWHYVSEGGATIVFSYKGPSHPDFDGTVLRLRKAPVLGGFPDGSTAFNEEEEPDDPTIEFQTTCMQRLIPPKHLPRLESIWLDRSWLEELVRLHDDIRPEIRRRKDQVDINRKKGVLATDLVGGDWLAIEIKPKWAFLPSLVHLSEETRAIKTRTCRFCMHSRFRAQKGHQKVTNYCPLDLFSGSESRVLKAIHCLWDAWITSDATANNLKIFAAGKFVRPSEAKRILADGYDEDLNTIRDMFATALVRPLLDTPVLRILSQLQRNLDILDIEGLSKLWRKIESAASEHKGTDSASFTPLGRNSPFTKSFEPTISDWNEFLDSYLSSERKDMDHGHPSTDDISYYLFAYLLSATFKDCSIIVRLDFLRPGDSSRQSVKTQPENVTVIDLDPKKLDKLKGWEELDKEIVNEYSTAVEKKICLDEWQHVEIKGQTVIPVGRVVVQEILQSLR